LVSMPNNIKPTTHRRPVETAGRNRIKGRETHWLERKGGEGCRKTRRVRDWGGRKGNQRGGPKGWATNLGCLKRSPPKGNEDHGREAKETPFIRATHGMRGGRAMSWSRQGQNDVREGVKADRQGKGIPSGQTEDGSEEEGRAREPPG